jgi:hypothetical protein
MTNKRSGEAGRYLEAGEKGGYSEKEVTVRKAW